MLKILLGRTMGGPPEHLAKKDASEDMARMLGAWRENFEAVSFFEADLK